MNSVLFTNIMRFILLVSLQVLVLNHINFLGYINPYLYILFIILFPIKNSRTLFVFLSFILGLTIDIFSDSGGIHAAACVSIAYVRPVFLKFCFGTVYEYQTVKFDTVEFSSKFLYITILTVLHHVILFSLEIFNISRIILTFQKTLFSSIFTIILCILVTVIFSRKTK
jgi:rod shape-determining protein MreD